MNIQAEVVKGKGIGKDYGYPTANMNLTGKQTGLEPGVYAAKARLFEKEYIASVVVENQLSHIEAYLHEYSGDDFYGETLQLTVDQKVDEYTPLEDNPPELIKKIENNVQLTKQYYE